MELSPGRVLLLGVSQPVGVRFNKFAGDFHVFDQFGVVKFEKVWAGFSKEVILAEEGFNIFCFVIKKSLFEFFHEDGDDVVGWSGRFGGFLRRWSGS